MTAAMTYLHKQSPFNRPSPLPPRVIAERALSAIGMPRRARRSQVATWTAHFAYGAAAGALYGPLSDRARGPIAGIAYGLLVWAVSYLHLMPASNLFPRPPAPSLRRTLTMVAAHVIWGAALDATLRRVPR